MVAIPIAYDQPGIAARIAHHGVGKFMEVEDLTVEGLSHLIQKVLSDPGYRKRAQYFRRVIAETNGLDLAADVIERAFLTRAAVTRASVLSGATPSFFSYEPALKLRRSAID